MCAPSVKCPKPSTESPVAKHRLEWHRDMGVFLLMETDNPRMK